MAKEISSKLGWRINLPDGTSKMLEPEPGVVWNLGVADPRKVIHCIKEGLALSIVSLFYYMRPLYDDFRGNAMSAVMTVVVVFEYTVGATLYKCINRIIGSFLAGALGVGIHWVAEQSGDELKPIILGISVFLFASAATFSRFIPTVEASFDYGALIFILTFSLISFWLPRGRVAEYFKDNGKLTIINAEDLNKKMQGYKCVLSSKATEESMANFARWEPKHGRFNFGHPWKQYLKIGASLRNCAYCIETLNSCIDSEIQAPPCIRKHLSSKCSKVSSYSTNVLKELAITMKKMKKSPKIDFRVAEMNFAVQELQDALKSLPSHLIASTSSSTEESMEAKAVTINKANVLPPIMKVLPLVTVVSLLAEIAARIGGVVDAVGELASLAEFKPAKDQKPKQNQPTSKPISNNLNPQTI
ncbi:hypothetical protein REPUB_Repub17cG0141800 [Reevesia pubescens]